MSRAGWSCGWKSASKFQNALSTMGETTSSKPSSRKERRNLLHDLTERVDLRGVDGLRGEGDVVGPQRHVFPGAGLEVLRGQRVLLALDLRLIERLAARVGEAQHTLGALAQLGEVGALAQQVLDRGRVHALGRLFVQVAHAFEREGEAPLVPPLARRGPPCRRRSDCTEGGPCPLTRSIQPRAPPHRKTSLTATSAVFAAATKSGIASDPAGFCQQLRSAALGKPGLQVARRHPSRDRPHTRARSSTLRNPPSCPSTATTITLAWSSPVGGDEIGDVLGTIAQGFP